MALFRDRIVLLSPARRLMCDCMFFSRRVPLLTVERRMDLQPLVHAWQTLVDRPSWFALFAKAYALVARHYEPLRRSYMSLPWPHLYQHADSAATCTIERRIGNEDCVFSMQISNPDQLPLREISALIHHAKAAPLWQVGVFWKQRILSWLPFPLRLLVWWVTLNAWGWLRGHHVGTFGITGVCSFGTDLVNFPTPQTTTLACGLFQPDGITTVRMMCDHRVVDGSVAARALVDLERTLNEEICEELLAMTPQEKKLPSAGVAGMLGAAIPSYRLQE